MSVNAIAPSVTRFSGKPSKAEEAQKTEAYEAEQYSQLKAVEENSVAKPQPDVVQRATAVVVETLAEALAETFGYENPASVTPQKLISDVFGLVADALKQEFFPKTE